MSERVREVLDTALAATAAVAIVAMQDALEALKRGADDDEVDEHLLAAQWARGEARGLRNAIFDLEEAGLVPPPPPPPPPAPQLQLVPKP